MFFYTHLETVNLYTTIAFFDAMADPVLGREIDDYIAKRKKSSDGLFSRMFKPKKAIAKKEEPKELPPEKKPARAEAEKPERFTFEDEEPNFFDVLHQKITNFFRKK
jgi:hypothetical protein